jgi:hypothetical protein
MESRKNTVGVASARLLVDTPDSQVVDVAPKGSDTLGTRATLLANLMVDGEIKNAIAKRAGLPPSRLIGIGPDSSTPAGIGPAPTRDSFVLTTSVTAISTDNFLPIVEIDTQAPDEAGAQKLANAAIEGLDDFLNSKAAAEAIRDGDRLDVTGMGTAQAREETRGPRMIYSLIAAILLFVAGCAALLGLDGVIRGLRSGETDAERFAARAARRLAEEPLDEAQAQLYELEEHRAARHPEQHEPAAGRSSSSAAATPSPPASSPSQRGSASWWGGTPG